MHFFSIDHEFIYEPFFADFGPLNLSMVWRFCKLVEAKLADPALAEKRLIYYCSHDPKKASQPKRDPKGHRVKHLKGMTTKRELSNWITILWTMII